MTRSQGAGRQMARARARPGCLGHTSPSPPHPTLRRGGGQLPDTLLVLTSVPGWVSPLCFLGVFSAEPRALSIPLFRDRPKVQGINVLGITFH